MKCLSDKMCDESTPPKKLKDNECEEKSVPAPPPGFTPPTPNSKNQLKKLKKLQNFEQYRKEKRKAEKERMKQKRREAVEKGLPRTGPSRKELKKRVVAGGENENPLRIAIDLDCDDMMSERDLAKCVKQCLRIYTVNRRSERPLQLHLTGIKSEGNIHKVLKKNDGWENWHLKYHFDKTHLEAFEDHKQLIYLTSESDTVLEKLDENRVYVIGGLVDHNHHKNYCHDRATKAGLQTARLPLGEYVDMKTRAVLTTFHVFEILVRVAEGKSWSEAILQTIPARKGAKPKQQTDDAENKVAIEQIEDNDASKESDENSTNVEVANIVDETKKENNDDSER